MHAVARSAVADISLGQSIFIEEALRLGAADLFGRENTANDSGLVEPEKPYKANGSFPLIQSSLAYVIYS